MENSVLSFKILNLNCHAIRQFHSWVYTSKN